jgi:hypothetical protein
MKVGAGAAERSASAQCEAQDVGSALREVWTV